MVNTPKSTELMEHFNKVNTQYMEGAITANEAICKMYSLVIENQSEISEEYDLEQKALENIDWLK
jgi:hypothetical protein